MKEHEVLISQYHAALAMLKQAIILCPEPRWASPDTPTPFWQIAYHALFYTHLYLQDSLQSFRPWPKHREDYLFSEQASPPHAQPPDKETLLSYLAFCEQQVVEQVSTLQLAADSGFEWLPFSKLELQLYTIRHIQQHVGELMERLGSHEQLSVDWVGSRHS